tara:strand:+ start:115 stop:2280 length:2166 start_codon:yes stop_codon:yes gene_type:complete
MTKKVTRDTLKKLISEVLQEGSFDDLRAVVNDVVFLSDRLQFKNSNGDDVIDIDSTPSDSNIKKIAKIKFTGLKPEHISRVNKDNVTNGFDIYIDLTPAGVAYAGGVPASSMLPPTSSTTNPAAMDLKPQSDKLLKSLSGEKSISNVQDTGQTSNTKAKFKKITGQTAAISKIRAAAKAALDHDVLDYKDFQSDDINDDFKSDYEQFFKPKNATKQVGGKPMKIPDSIPSETDLGITGFEYEMNNIPDWFKEELLDTFNNDAGIRTVAAIAERKFLKEETSKLDWEDFYVIMNNPQHPFFRKAIKTIRKITNKYPNEQASKDLKKIIGRPSDSTDELTPSTPTVDVSDLYGGDRNTVPSYIVSAFNGMNLGANSSLVDRMKVINQYTEKIASGDFKKGDFSITELMSAISVMNSLARIVRRMDNKAAGWAFESFLAQLVNGTTEGTNMGAADFVFGIGENTLMPPGTKGSAKLLSSNSFSQSKYTLSACMPGTSDQNTFTSTFGRDDSARRAGVRKKEDVNWGNNKLVYLVGIKRDSGGIAISDPSKIVKVDLYFVTMTRNSGTGVMDRSELSYGLSNKTPGVQDNSFTFSVDTDGDFIGSIYLSSDLETLDDLGKQAIDKIDTDLPKLINSMESFSRNTKSYLTSGKADSINAAVDSYVSLFSLINQVFGDPDEAYAKETGVTAGVETDSSNIKAKKAVVPEQKITTNLIKKLIQEKFKK